MGNYTQSTDNTSANQGEDDSTELSPKAKHRIARERANLANRVHQEPLNTIIRNDWLPSKNVPKNIIKLYDYHLL